MNRKRSRSSPPWQGPHHVKRRVRAFSRPKVSARRKDSSLFVCYAATCKKRFASHQESKAHFLAAHSAHQIETGEPPCTEEEFRAFCEELEFLTQSRLSSKANAMKGAKLSIFTKESVALEFLKRFHEEQGVTLRFSIFKPKRRYEVFFAQVGALASLPCQEKRWWIRGFVRGRSRGFVFQPRSDQEFAAVHRLLCHMNHDKKQREVPQPKYAIRFTFAHRSVSSNASNVSCTSAANLPKIMRTSFQCRVSFCVASDNVQHVVLTSSSSAEQQATVRPPPPPPPPPPTEPYPPALPMPFTIPPLPADLVSSPTAALSASVDKSAAPLSGSVAATAAAIEKFLPLAAFLARPDMSSFVEY